MIFSKTAILICPHFQKKDSDNIKPIPAFKPIPNDNATPESSPEKSVSSINAVHNISINNYKLPKKKPIKSPCILKHETVAITCVSSSAVQDSDNFSDKNMFNATGPSSASNLFNVVKSETVTTRIKTETSSEEAVKGFLQSALCDSDTSKGERGSDKGDKGNKEKKKKKSISSSASASPRSQLTRSPSPSSYSFDTKTSPSTNQSSSIYGSLIANEINKSLGASMEKKTENRKEVSKSQSPLPKLKLPNFSKVAYEQSSKLVEKEKRKYKKSPGNAPASPYV